MNELHGSLIPSITSQRRKGKEAEREEAEEEGMKVGEKAS